MAQFDFWVDDDFFDSPVATNAVQRQEPACALSTLYTELVDLD
jgi:hypothetical protein